MKIIKMHSDCQSRPSAVLLRSDLLQQTSQKHHENLAEPTEGHSLSLDTTTSRDSTRAARGTSSRRLLNLLAYWTSFSSCVGKERPPRSSHRGADQRFGPGTNIKRHGSMEEGCG